MTPDTVAQFTRVCSLDEIWEGEMAVFEAGGHEVLIVHSAGGLLAAFDPECPHQSYPLVNGALDGRTLTCAAHLWEFDAVTGAGVNPKGCMLKRYPVKVEADDVFVAI